MTYQFQHGRNIRSQSGSSSAEFAPALFILFVVVLLPMLSLFTFIAGAATVYFATNYAAREAGTATTRYLAQQSMFTARDQIINGPLGKFCNMTANGGTDEKGMVLMAISVPLLGGIRREKGFLEGDFTLAELNPNTRFFQYKVISTYKIRPLFYPSDIPMQFSATINAEHREGLNTITP